MPARTRSRMKNTPGWDRGLRVRMHVLQQKHILWRPLRRQTSAPCMMALASARYRVENTPGRKQGNSQECAHANWTPQSSDDVFKHV